MALATEGKHRAWWQAYNLPYRTYVGLEADAASIGGYNSAVVSGVLHVERYACSIFQAAVPRIDRVAIEQRVEARLMEQGLPTQGGLHYIIDEGAMHRQVGGSAVMRAQLERIIGIASFWR